MSSSENEAAQGSGAGPPAPTHHYVLAHLALREICMENPLAFFGIIGSAHRDAFLKDVWEHVCKFCQEVGDPPFNIQDVQVVTSQVNGFPLVMFLFPPPNSLAEALMTAAVLKVPFEELSQTTENAEVAYFTLELDLDAEGKAKTALCGWDKEGNHLNFGDGPAETHPAKFVEAIQSRL